MLERVQRPSAASQGVVDAKLNQGVVDAKLNPADRDKGGIMEGPKIRKLVGRDTKAPSTRLRSHDEVVSAFEDVYTELFHLARGVENEPSERIKALSECRRVLADLLAVNKPTQEEPPVTSLFSVLPTDEK